MLTAKDKGNFVDKVKELLRNSPNKEELRISIDYNCDLLPPNGIRIHCEVIEKIKGQG